MVVTCSIVDDEPLALRLIESYVRRTPFLEHSKSYLDAELMMLDIKRGDLPMLIFSDIQMTQINGIELSRMLPATTKVIFTTAYSRYAIDGFKVNALDFLLKPISYDDFLASAEKAHTWFEKEYKASQAERFINEAQPAQVLQVKVERQTVNIPVNDIIRVEGLGDYVKIFRRDGTMTLSLMRMKNILDMLPGDQFARVHKSHIVRLSEVSSFDKSHLTIAGETLPVTNSAVLNNQFSINK